MAARQSEPMINILYIIDSLTHGGTEKQLVQLIGNLDRQQFRPHLCTLKRSEFPVDELGIPHLYLDFRSFIHPALLNNIRNLSRFIKDHHIDVVQTFFQDPFLLGALVKPLTRVKLIGSFRDLGFWRTISETLKMRFACRFFDGFIANSQAVKDHFVKNDRLNADKIAVIYNGLDLSQLPTTKKDPQPNPVIGIVANLNRPVKRVDDFIRAAALIAEKHRDARFVVVGGGHLKAALEELAQTLGLEDRIVFTGRVANPLEYAQDFTIGVIASETEGFCNAIIEYMALGLPVVATDAGGNPELVKPRVNGLLYPVGIVEELAQKICNLLNNPERYGLISESNTLKIRENFSLPTMTGNYQAYLAGFFPHKINHTEASR